MVTTGRVVSHDPRNSSSPNPTPTPHPAPESLEVAPDGLSREVLRVNSNPPRMARDRVVLLLLAVIALAISLPLLPNQRPAAAGNAGMLPPYQLTDFPPPTATPTPESPQATPSPTQPVTEVPEAGSSAIPTQPAGEISTPTPTWTPVLLPDQFTPTFPPQPVATATAVGPAATSQPALPPPATATALPGTGLVPPPPPTQVVPTVPAVAPSPTPTPIVGIVIVRPPTQDAQPVAERSFDLALFIDNLVVAFGYVWIACGLLLLPLAVIGGFLLARRPRQPYTPVHIPPAPQPPGTQTGAAPPPPQPPPAAPPPVEPASSGGSQRVAARRRSNGANDSERPPG